MEGFRQELETLVAELDLRHVRIQQPTAVVPDEGGEPSHVLLAIEPVSGQAPDEIPQGTAVELRWPLGEPTRRPRLGGERAGDAAAEAEQPWWHPAKAATCFAAEEGEGEPLGPFAEEPWRLRSALLALEEAAAGLQQVPAAAEQGSGAEQEAEGSDDASTAAEAAEENKEAEAPAAADHEGDLNGAMEAKAQGNAAFGRGELAAAADAYSRAIAVGPTDQSFNEDCAKCFSNRALCWMQLSRSLLARIKAENGGTDPRKKSRADDPWGGLGGELDEEGGGMDGSDDEWDEANGQPRRPRQPDPKYCDEQGRTPESLLEDALDDLDEALRLAPTYIKAVLRRAKALEELGRLEEAVEDLEAAVKMETEQPGVSSGGAAEKQLAATKKALAAKTEEMKEEMMGKLKGIGNSVLGYFGLSLDNFKVQQDQNGSYSVQFDQNPGGAAASGGGAAQG